MCANAARTLEGLGLNRRQLLIRTGMTLGAPPVPTGGRTPSLTVARAPNDIDWNAVRDQFNLAPDRIQMTGFYLASHPAAVREAIELYRRGLDEDPFSYYHANNDRLIVSVLRAAGEYLGVDPVDVALTDSTTMGLGLLYGGLQLREGQEILTTSHDHYSTSYSLRLRAERTGAVIREISLYDDPTTASKEEIVARLTAAVRPETRIVAVTWVHSGTGVKLPIKELAAALAELNASRAEEDRALLCVDGVHGLGVEDVTLTDLGCDFFVAGCHKWLLGPRGTGLIWGAPHAWPAARATIPTFDGGVYAELATTGAPLAGEMTPGGFHSFEHRWALEAAFRFHLELGKATVAERVHELSRQLKEGLAELPLVTLRTPVDAELSAGIVCFEIAGLTPEEVVTRLLERGVVASVTPYATRYARLGPGLMNTNEEVDRTIDEVARLGGT